MTTHVEVPHSRWEWLSSMWLHWSWKWYFYENYIESGQKLKKKKKKKKKKKRIFSYISSNFGPIWWVKNRKVKRLGQRQIRNRKSWCVNSSRKNRLRALKIDIQNLGFLPGFEPWLLASVANMQLFQPRGRLAQDVKDKINRFLFCISFFVHSYHIRSIFGKDDFVFDHGNLKTWFHYWINVPYFSKLGDPFNALDFRFNRGPWWYRYFYSRSILKLVFHSYFHYRQCRLLRNDVQCECKTHKIIVQLQIGQEISVSLNAFPRRNITALIGLWMCVCVCVCVC